MTPHSKVQSPATPDGTFVRPTVKFTDLSILNSQRS